MEKINKAQRLDKKKEEGRRMKKLVDNAFNSDPRIAKYVKYIMINYSFIVIDSLVQLATSHG